MEEKPFLGLRTVIYAAPALAETKRWYAQALDLDPYFDESFYVGFNVGGYELGLDPNAQVADGSTLTYWGVRDVEAAQQRLLQLGATLHAPVQDVGGGIKTAAVNDPFGNVIGIIENPYFSL
ncbi:VOC family protein [Spirosoma taeanense]|uniref:VOC family protein n=1 Tax=Spirosoma taeanense TaxID=2735870 RepID=A0A6M5Y6U7_9BACT|nr:VOC family protein [Spirosoma taeanense]QJW90128.1 VOC family protein [Spirosoma taeanense]